jgi:hypothetical protein
MYFGYFGSDAQNMIEVTADMNLIFSFLFSLSLSLSLFIFQMIYHELGMMLISQAIFVTA